MVLFVWPPSKCRMHFPMNTRSSEIADRVETFVRQQVIPYEKDHRLGPHGPGEVLVLELKALTRAAGVLTPAILPDGSHLNHQETAEVLIRSVLSPLGPVACNTAAPDEGNMFRLVKVARPELKRR